MGIVIREANDEIRAIEAPTFVSAPYDAGNITVFNPNGIAREHNVKECISSEH